VNTIYRHSQKVGSEDLKQSIAGVVGAAHVVDETWVKR
jgi:hypothetical protein